MKLITLLGAVFLVSLTLDAHARRMDRREHRQTNRIQHGVQNGSLTKREARGLAREQKRVHKMENRAESDGNVTKKERVRIERAQDKASRDIYRQKHDGQSR